MLLISSCARYEPAALDPGYDAESLNNESISISIEESIDETESEGSGKEAAEALSEEASKQADSRVPARVKGIYVASKPLANESFMSSFWDVMDSTELNAVVIDIKDDYGKITYDMKGVPALNELNSVESVIEDMPSLMKKFKEHGVYTIARIVSLRDPNLADTWPEVCMTNPDGTVFKDGSGYAWVNPYKTEYWELLLDIAMQCAEDGFDEIQFDYMRFCTEKGSDDCIFDEEEVKGRDKISIITELVDYLYCNLRERGVFVSVDCFGTIIGSKVDSRAVGQNYGQLSSVLDYICPMIYPSHYSSGNFGLEHPDTRPYEAVSGALNRSRNELARAKNDANEHQAVVRPWLQSFTASWLGEGNYIKYDADAIRKQIQAVYDSGYDEWLLWSASVSYDFDAMLTDSQAAEEDQRIAESRAALPPEEDTLISEEETFPDELQKALENDDLRPEDEQILLEDGPIVTYE
ncbi:MAG: putative glycoside hydrolase [Eubacteriales bacterium]|nr:putative glycoside hydrolase [Eubacteriales bacterium]